MSKELSCVICRQGKLAPGMATVMVAARETVVVVKQVPADICDTCGEYYLSQEMAEQIDDIVDAAAARGAEVEIIRYAA
ncbi:MAG: type II toxin-antitoxin system MqsA family antitoxin [Dehalococcoidia bacterium]|nr:type II toxin-antitoxin system MqsA family antitoxin [Dehalococcoidia bacterium]